MQNTRSSTTQVHQRTFQYFDDRTALALSQAFSQEQELEPLLSLMHAQLGALCGSAGIRYAYKPANLELALGRQERHTNEFNLTYRDVELGKLTLYYARPAHSDATATAEDVIALAFTAIRNAVTQLQLRTLQQEQGESLSTAEKKALKQAGGDSKSSKTDTLILLALDNLEEIQASDGAEWAQVIMSSTHEQIQEGLRSADGVYHVGDDLIAVLLPNTSEQQALAVAKKMRSLIASLHLRGNAIDMQLTASMGVANAQHGGVVSAQDTSKAEDVMARARRALARAQCEGPNQICLSQESARARSGESPSLGKDSKSS